MAFQFNTTDRNAALDAIETSIGTAPILKIRTGAPPADCSTADSGTVLASITLPSDWLAAASAGAKSKLGTWDQPSAASAGTAGHFRIYDSGGTVCRIQGTITSTLTGTGDMLLDNTVIAVGQDVLITAFTINAGGA